MIFFFCYLFYCFFSFIKYLYNDSFRWDCTYIFFLHTEIQCLFFFLFVRFCFYNFPKKYFFLLSINVLWLFWRLLLWLWCVGRAESISMTRYVMPVDDCCKEFFLFWVIYYFSTFLVFIFLLCLKENHLIHLAALPSHSTFSYFLTLLTDKLEHY